MQMPVAADAMAFPLSGTQREAAFSTFAAKRPPPKNWRARCCGVAGVAFIYAALILGFVFAGQGYITRKLEPKAITVAIESEPVIPVDIVPPPPVTPPALPEIPDIVMPEFIVNTPPPVNAITLPPPPEAAPVAPPPPPEEMMAHAPPDIMDPYYREVSAHLRPYMRGARGQREAGIATVQFTIDRHGRLVSQRVSHSSGSQTLDSTAISILQRAAPFPPFPEEMIGDRLPLEFQIEFTLR